VGFTVPFAFAVSALWSGQGGADWLARTRRWSLVAWSCLTVGIVLGGWWSYAVLGWGGYWAWDPVENASLLPWLAATALLHSAVVQARRGRLQAWNFALVIATFALTVLGTFLTRSGVIASVHSFTQSAIGPLLLGFLVVVLVASLALLGLRGHLVASPAPIESLASREGAFLVNNLLLSLFAFTVLTGSSTRWWWRPSAARRSRSGGPTSTA
jgi:cytochrome c-type biogenesis protein CcmF